MSAKSEAARERMRKYGLESYYFYKQLGICCVCKTRYAAPGRVQCEICTRQKKARNAQLDPGGVKNNARGKERRERLKAQGICVDCGRKPARESETRCPDCARKRKESLQVRRIKKRLKEG